MALNPSRTALTLSCKALPRCCAPAQSTAHRLASSVRHLSTPSARHNADFAGATADMQERPRWSYTPERMKGPGFSINIVKDPSRTVWEVNEDPAKLDAVYNRLLGPKGDRTLTDEIKWLAITHKSFDQGRRGFNTRLAYFGVFPTSTPLPEPSLPSGLHERGGLIRNRTGRLILALETTRHIMVTPGAARDSPVRDQFGREPFQHHALANVDKLSTRQPRDFASKEKLAKLAIEVGLPGVVRWKPRMVRIVTQTASHFAPTQKPQG